MTDNFQDFEHEHNEHELHEDMPPPPATGIRGNLTSAWRTQPLFKLFVLMIVVGAIVAVAVSLFSGSNSRSSVDMVKPPDMREAPGGKSSPYLKEQTEMANKQRTDMALQNGGSSVATPIGPSTDNGELNAAVAKEDPLNELRAEVDNMNKQLQDAKQAQAAPQAPAAAPEPFDDSLAQAMQRQMGQMLDAWAPKAARMVTVSDDINGKSAADAAAAAAAAGSTGIGTSAANNAVPPAKAIIPAGTVSYAQLLTEANSDVPGPILGQLVSGPLKGARIVGQFQVANSYSDYLVLTFKLATLKGSDYQINAIALDPDTTLGGMATEVDERYFTRLVLPAAAGFLQGFAGALGQGDTTYATNGDTTIIQQSSHSVRQGMYSGFDAAAQTAGQFFQTQANLTKPLIRVAAGTPMGMFFVESVFDNNGGMTQAQENNALYGQNGQGGPNGQNGYGQNGYGQNGYGQGMGGNAYGNAGYPVLYPNAVTGTPINTNNTGVNIQTNPGYGGYGVGYNGAGYGGGASYPGSTVYYPH